MHLIRQPRTLLVLTTVAAVVLAVLAVGMSGSSGIDAARDAATGARGTPSVAAPPLPQSGQLGIEEQVTFWRARVDRAADDYLSRTQLAAALLRQAKARHDLGAALDARTELERSLDVNPDHGPARALLAASYAMFHEFARARDIALAAYAEDPTNLVALATAGDAAFELGDLEDADRLYVELAGRAGAGPAVDARRARLASARGDHATAVSYARAAQRAAGGATPSERAYYALLVGELHRSAGELTDAAHALADALRADPESGAAIESLAKVRAAQGRLAAADTLWRRSGALIGAPDFHVLAARGDIAEARGDLALARQRWDDALAAAAALPREEQAGLARDLALFRADHGIGTAEAVRLARADLERRQDPLAFATLGWALAADGDDRAALEHLDRAREGGVSDAGFAYRMAVVYERVGRDDVALDVLRPALATNPRFDLRAADAAAALLAALEGRR
ncbi:MAG TPA: hypothetical protein VFZ83_04860 [Acidimicrobiia bacterium]|nr:hypothetical protein [Acidimicrobiia bacterium]